MTISMPTLLDEYFGWLCTQIEPRRSSKTYDELFELLWETPFLAFVPNDDNRVGDAVELMVEFFHYKGVEVEYEHLQGERCTVLELIISLSRRLAFQAGGEQEKWAWQLITNLGLDRLSGQITRNQRSKALRILDDFIWRRYEPNGVGGLFPLRNPQEDQTEVEIWYQMHAYIEEHSNW